MITISIKATGLVVDGHSESAVCAAVSAMTDTVLDALAEIGGQTMKLLESGSGYYRAEWGQLTERGATVLASYALGISRIADSCPGTIKIQDFPSGFPR